MYQATLWGSKDLSVTKSKSNSSEVEDHKQANNRTDNV